MGSSSPHATHPDVIVLGEYNSQAHMRTALEDTEFNHNEILTEGVSWDLVTPTFTTFLA